MVLALSRQINKQKVYENN